MEIVFYEIATLKYPYIVTGEDYADAQYASGSIDLNLRNFKLTFESNSITVYITKFQRFIKAEVKTLYKDNDRIGLMRENSINRRIPDLVVCSPNHH